MANPTYTIDDAAILARIQEVTDASFVNGANNAGSCAPAIGVNVGGGAVVGTSEQFTLNDQFGAARTPQNSMLIGGTGYVARAAYPSSGGNEGIAGNVPVDTGPPSDSGDGTIVSDGAATLTSLSGGWVAV